MEYMACLKSIGVVVLMAFLAACSSYQIGVNPAYIPDEAPEFLSADQVLLLMSDEEENYVYTGSASSFKGGSEELTVPLGKILREVSEEILEDRFSGGISFSNDFASSSEYLVTLHPSIAGFSYGYYQLRNLGLWITPQVEVSLNVEILDAAGQSIFEKGYESGTVIGDGYFQSFSAPEKINNLLHQTIYNLLEQSFIDAKPLVIESLSDKLIGGFSQAGVRE